MNVCIIVNRDKDKELKISKKVCTLFEKHNSSCYICEQESNGGDVLFTDPGKLPENIDCIMTIGGDGTLIQAARDLYKMDIPIIGVNLGTLGFLAELDINSIPSAVRRLCNGDYFIEDHMMLYGSIYRDGKCIYNNFALNDAVISKYGHYHVIYFDVFVDDQLLCDYSADGLIISTPTGSTAYNLSAGGPLILPNASMMVLTPICAHALYSRSICLPESSCIKIRIKNKYDDCSLGCAVTFDGAVTMQLQSGDEVLLEKSNISTKLLKLDHTSFIKVLQKKMS